MVSVDYDDYDRLGYCSIDILQQCYGMPWNEYTLAAVSAFRPSSIRVIKYGGDEKCDARNYRITVYVDELSLVTKIQQECEIWLPKDCRDGQDISEKANLYD